MKMKKIIENNKSEVKSETGMAKKRQVEYSFESVYEDVEIYGYVDERDVKDILRTKE